MPIAFWGLRKKPKQMAYRDLFWTSLQGPIPFRDRDATFKRQYNVPFRFGILGPSRDVHTTSGAILVKAGSPQPCVAFYKHNLANGTKNLQNHLINKHSFIEEVLAEILSHHQSKSVVTLFFFM